MLRTSRPVTVTLGDLRKRVEARVKSGAYASVSEVVRAAVRALEREEAALDDWLRQGVDEALADPRPSVPARKVIARLRDLHSGRVKARTLRLIFLFVISFALAACASPVSFPNARLNVDDRSLETVSGLLFKPEGQGPFPAVVLLHSCGGFLSHVTRDWPDYLTGHGYVVLSVDTFGSRGYVRCPNPYMVVPPFVTDAYGALDYLAARPFVDKDRVAVIGFSLGASAINGGIIPLRVRASGGPDFKAAVAFYGNCAYIGLYPKGSTPLMEILAENDPEFTPGCQAATKMHPEIEVHVIPGAYHNFDSHESSGKRGYLGERMEYSWDATRKARELTRAFLARRLGG